MTLGRRQLIGYALATPMALALGPAQAADRQTIEREMVTTWYRLVLELVRHTATQSPPVASRAFAYIGIAAHEALATGNVSLVSLAGPTPVSTAERPATWARSRTIRSAT